MDSYALHRTPIALGNSGMTSFRGPIDIDKVSRRLSSANIELRACLETSPTIRARLRRSNRIL
jgi:hypothetical protein